jgi:peptidoglycan/xylan/chitin deacetylase (PgdA/CDA1 family)
MSQMIASLSLDLDNKWSYLKTHGDRGWEELPSYLDGVVPRFLELLGKLDLKITVFVVGQDAALAKNRNALAALAAAGHEIGNHSFHHEPWLHLYSPEEIEEEIGSAEETIAEATGAVPHGFRGPGYSLSPAVLQCLMRRGYQYDASTLPTLIGPLARAYYFLHARLNSSQKEERKRLFGNLRDGLRPLRPFWWESDRNGSAFGKQRLLEIPVTTLPLLRVPIHFSYLLYLRSKSSAAAWSYWRLAMRACQTCCLEPSLLLHPLDFLGGDEERDLGFFPGMKLTSAVKTSFVAQLLADYSRRFRVVTLGEHAARLANQSSLRINPVASSGRRCGSEYLQTMSVTADAAFSRQVRIP